MIKNFNFGIYCFIAVVCFKIPVHVMVISCWWSVGFWYSKWLAISWDTCIWLWEVISHCPLDLLLTNVTPDCFWRLYELTHHWWTFHLTGCAGVKGLREQEKEREGYQPRYHSAFQDQTWNSISDGLDGEEGLPERLPKGRGCHGNQIRGEREMATAGRSSYIYNL